MAQQWQSKPHNAKDLSLHKLQGHCTRPAKLQAVRDTHNQQVGERAGTNRKERKAGRAKGGIAIPARARSTLEHQNTYCLIWYPVFHW